MNFKLRWPVLWIATSAMAAEVPDEDAVNALSRYWSQFEVYEKDLNQKREDEFQQGWQKLQDDYQRKSDSLSDAQVSSLKRAIATYEKNLESHRAAPNRAYTLFNLAQVLNKLGQHHLARGDQEGVYYRNKALVYLKEVEVNHPGFSSREAAIYLRAIILSSTGQDKEARILWRKLAKSGENSIYGVHANIAAGDYYFEDDDPRKARDYYKAALALLERIDVSHPDYERIRILYRIAWASYRSADPEGVIQYASQLIIPGRKIKSLPTRKKIQQDAVELLGDILFETDDLQRFEQVMADKRFLQFAPKIALRTMQRYAANGIHIRVIRIGKIVSEEFPISRELPQILSLSAQAADRLKNKGEKVAFLEKMALLLPKRSLWRAKYDDDLQAVQTMESKGLDAARFVAAHHYDYGLTSHRNASFMTAASFYTILLETDPHGPMGNQWRLKRAHCYFFGNRFETAAVYYKDLINNYKVDDKHLETAMYQLVLTNERLWRQAFTSAGEFSEARRDDPIAQKFLKDLELSIERYIARFSGTPRAMDLLLVVAGAYRDHNKLGHASKFWQRVLVSDPKPPQRAIAIRGIIYEKLHNGSAGDVVQVARRFLRLENWQKVGLTLGNELHGILSSSVQEEGDRLNEAGQVRQGGALMVNVAKEFQKIPEREKVFRDGAYMLAIAGDWKGAETAATSYLDEGLKKYAGDMTYLLGRSFEYQLMFRRAATQYLQLGTKFPKHPRAIKSLKNAETMAASEGQDAMAAQAVFLYGDLVKDRAEKLNAYSRAAQYALAAEKPELGLKIARKRFRASKSRSERYRSRLLLAKMKYAVGQESAAIADYGSLAKNVSSNRGNIDQKTYAEVAGETYFLLGEEARRQFDDFDVLERSGSLPANVEFKSKYFEDLVKKYDQAAAVDHPDWGPRARYRLAEAAEKFADEISQVPVRSSRPITLKTQQRFSSYVKRLQDLAKKYYGNNVIVRNKNPQLYANNEWINKSSRRLATYGDMDHKKDYREKLPKSVHLDLPYQWSL